MYRVSDFHTMWNCQVGHSHASEAAAAECEMFAYEPEKWAALVESRGDTVITIDGRPTGILHA